MQFKFYIFFYFHFIYNNEKKKIIAQFFDDTKTHNLKFLMKINLNSDKIFKYFKFDIEINYIRMLIFWNELIFMFFFMIVQYCWIFIDLYFILMKQIRKKKFQNYIIRQKND